MGKVDKDHKNKDHYIIGEYYNVGGEKRMLTSINYCTSDICNLNPCVGKLRWTPSNTGECGELTNIHWLVWEEPKVKPLKRLTESDAFELAAVKYEMLLEDYSPEEVEQWLKEQSHKYDISVPAGAGLVMNIYSTNFHSDCPLCHYYLKMANGGCHDCENRCKSLAIGGKCYRAWEVRAIAPTSSKKLLGAEFRRVADSLKENGGR